MTQHIPKPAHAGRGLSLIEAVTALGLTALVSSLALPPVTEYMARGRIVMATTRLTAKHLLAEQYFSRHFSYEGAPSCAPDAASSQHFDYACTDLDGQRLLLEARGKGSMAGFVFTIDQQGVLRTASVPRGWLIPANNCAVMHRDGRC